MAHRAIHRYARISPRKVRPLADLVRGKYADEALAILQYQPHRGARLLEKVIKSALGNAQDDRQSKGRAPSVEELVVAEAKIDGGPMFKRIRPRSRGQAFMILKRTSHITVELQHVDNLG
jgi:large subunit ribosomal protein L22